MANPYRPTRYYSTTCPFYCFYSRFAVFCSSIQIVRFSSPLSRNLGSQHTRMKRKNLRSLSEIQRPAFAFCQVLLTDARFVFTGLNAVCTPNGFSFALWLRECPFRDLKTFWGFQLVSCANTNEPGADIISYQPNGSGHLLMNTGQYTAQPCLHIFSVTWYASVVPSNAQLDQSHTSSLITQQISGPYCSWLARRLRSTGIVNSLVVRSRFRSRALWKAMHVSTQFKA